MPDRIEATGAPPDHAAADAADLDALAEALAQRDLLDRARTVLEREYGIAAFEASEWLCREAVATNRRVRDVAAAVVETGRI